MYLSYATKLSSFYLINFISTQSLSRSDPLAITKKLFPDEPSVGSFSGNSKDSRPLFGPRPLRIMRPHLHEGKSREAFIGENSKIVSSNFNSIFPELKHLAQ